MTPGPDARRDRCTPVAHRCRRCRAAQRRAHVCHLPGPIGAHTFGARSLRSGPHTAAALSIAARAHRAATPSLSPLVRRCAHRRSHQPVTRRHQCPNRLPARRARCRASASRCLDSCSWRECATKAAISSKEGPPVPPEPLGSNRRGPFGAHGPRGAALGPLTRSNITRIPASGSGIPTPTRPGSTRRRDAAPPPQSEPPCRVNARGSPRERAGRSGTRAGGQRRRVSQVRLPPPPDRLPVHRRRHRQGPLPPRRTRRAVPECHGHRSRFSPRDGPRNGPRAGPRAGPRSRPRRRPREGDRARSRARGRSARGAGPFFERTLSGHRSSHRSSHLSTHAIRGGDASEREGGGELPARSESTRSLARPARSRSDRCRLDRCRSRKSSPPWGERGFTHSLARPSSDVVHPRRTKSESQRAPTSPHQPCCQPLPFPIRLPARGPGSRTPTDRAVAEAPHIPHTAREAFPE